jgi:hypothetical protein
LALWAALQAGARAAPRRDPAADPADAPGADARRTTDVITTYTYLPLVAQGYRLFVNGDFEAGLAGWETARGPFDGHGSGLPQGAVAFDGGRRALLGEPDAADHFIPVGYGAIAQTFTLNVRYLKLRYWVFSYDIARGETRYYDTFEVSINRPPADISDAEREDRGCAGARLNPEGTVSLSGDGLALCGGRPGATGWGSPWDSGGWKTVALDLSAFQGANVTLYLAAWSREVDAPFYDDHAWYNTWAYVDDVQPSGSP